MCGDPATTAFRLIDADLRAHPDWVWPLDPDLLERVRQRVEEVEVSMERFEPGNAQPPAPHHP